MKLKLIGFLVGLAALPASASVTLQTQFGTAFNSSSVQVPAGTLWALVVDTDNNSTFAGGFGLDGSLQLAGANSTFSTGQTLTVGNLLGGDTIFAVGGFDGGGLASDTITLDLGTLGVTAGRNYAFYWFPGSTYVSGTSGTITGTQAGGIHTSSNTPESQLTGMVIPTEGSNVDTGAATAAVDGNIPNSRFTAVNLIPEPSTALLGAIGALGLLRRRR